MKRVLSFAVVCSLAAVPAFAQGGTASDNPLTQGGRGAYEGVKSYLTKAAEQVPESLYGFKATPDVRSLGQLFAHVADANFMICGAAAGEKPSSGDIEKTTRPSAPRFQTASSITSAGEPDASTILPATCLPA